MNSRQRKKWQKGNICTHFKDESYYYHGYCDEEHHFCKMKQSENHCNCEICRHYFISQNYRRWIHQSDKDIKRHPLKYNLELDIDNLLKE